MRNGQMRNHRACRHCCSNLKNNNGVTSLSAAMFRMSMKMAAISTISLLLLCCVAISPADSQDGCDHNALKGKDFTVPLSSKLEPSHQLKWRHNDKVILDLRKGNIFVLGKKEDITKDGSLLLKNLKDTDQGKYTPELFTTDGTQTGKPKSINLCIFDRVPKPNVTKACSLPFVTFTCQTTAKPKDLKFAWLQNNKVLEKEKTKTLKRKAEEVENDSFQCKVSNPVTSETSGPVKQEPCFKPKSILPETLFGISIWVFVGAGIGIVVVLIIIVIACCVCTKRKKRMRLKEEEELRLAWTNDQQHHQHQHNHPSDPRHHRCQQQPAGHTGPRQHRSKQHREQQQHPRALDPPGAYPEPSPRRLPQAPQPVDKTDDEQPPPLPQPRKKAVKIQRV
ncbi:hepatocyte cell adhesion molecule-like isoform X2 [Perca fluviatilis]|uniref:hepatocyte cell adhesion molecule-like isoform X2 n=1 Tax=Perca fluviatilis TaxID=8168 RepID=UPI001966175E|nr:hepatocyte cell adhesion molecule-like isoform X2 [Perca fluviatilis]